MIELIFSIYLPIVVMLLVRLSVMWLLSFSYNILICFDAITSIIIAWFHGSICHPNKLFTFQFYHIHVFRIVSTINCNKLQQGHVDLGNSNGCSYTRKASNGRQIGVTKQTIIMMSLRISLRPQTVTSRAVVWPQVTIYLSQLICLN